MDCQGVHILFCDHDPSTGAETVKLLNKYSYKVTVVKSARQVVEVLNMENSAVDIVLADVELPQEKSFKMLKHILGQGRLSHIAVVVISERDDMAVVAKCLRLGAVDYLVKPLRSNEVMNLWTHMWRRRQMLGLPEKCVAVKHVELLKPIATVDLLASYCDRKCFTPAKDACSKLDSMDCTPPQLELSLKLSLNYNVGNVADQAVTVSKLKLPDFAPLPTSPVNDRACNPSAFSGFAKSSNQQPDEQSATNICSPISQFSGRPRKCYKKESLESISPAAHTSQHSAKDSSVGDENRPGDMESQVCDVPRQLPVQCMATGERVLYVEQMPSSTHQQGFQPCFSYAEPCQDIGQSFSNAVQEGRAAVGYPNATLNTSPVQSLPRFHHEAGLTNAPAVSNLYSYYPLTHLAVPVVNFSTWPTVNPSPPPVAGGKLIEVERREAALSKFRMKRKGRCFEKKIRYASRKKLAEQRPRIRGQFVKRTAVMGVVESVALQCGFDEEEGEADDEQGCSELDNQSSPECV